MIFSILPMLKRMWKMYFKRFYFFALSQIDYYPKSYLLNGPTYVRSTKSYLQDGALKTKNRFVLRYSMVRAKKCNKAKKAFSIRIKKTNSWNWDEDRAMLLDQNFNEIFEFFLIIHDKDTIWRWKGKTRVLQQGFH